MSQLQVTFRAGTLEQYEALAQKDEGCLYFITDKNMIFRGTVNVTSRYLIGSIPAASNPAGLDGIRLTDQMTGHVYDIPMLSSVSGLLETNLVLRFSETILREATDIIGAIEATDGVPASGTVDAGTVIRCDFGDQYVPLNPGQFAKPDYLYAKGHDLVVALAHVRLGKYNPNHNQSLGQTWSLNHQAFAVIPTDLFDLVTAVSELELNHVVLGAGGKKVKTMPFTGANKVLRTNSANNGVEWVTPETVENVVYWEDIAES